MHPASSTPAPVGVIPVRYGSSRFPGKPLALIQGKPLVWHVWQCVTGSNAFSKVIIATDDERIEQTVRGFGGDVRRTSDRCFTGTDRVAEIAQSLPASDQVFINIQGDQAIVHPECLRQLALAFTDMNVEMATLVRPLDAAEENNPSVVKAVVGKNGNALYFSRLPIPFSQSGKPVTRYAHLGIYGYRRDTLLRLAGMEPTPLEQAESLEQLRALENGIGIRALVTPHRSHSVDTPEDLPKVEAALAAF